MLRREGFQIVDVRLHTRRVRLSYLASRLDAYAPPVARALVAGLERVGLDERTVGIKLGDIFTVIARKPADDVTSAAVDRARARGLVAAARARWAGRCGGSGGRGAIRSSSSGSRGS